MIRDNLRFDIVFLDIIGVVVDVDVGVRDRFVMIGVVLDVVFNLWVNVVF